MGQITKDTIAMIRKCVEQGSPPPLTAWEYEQLCRFAEAAIVAHTPPAEHQVAQEPVAWMFPDDLKKFEFGEHTATAYSIKVGSPDGVSVPLYTHPSPALAELRAKVKSITCSGNEPPWFIRDQVLAEIDKLGGKV